MIRSEAIGAILVVSIIVSCTASKKMALSCPEPASHYKNNVTIRHNKKARSFIAFPVRNRKRNYFSKGNKTNQGSDKSVLIAHRTDAGKDEAFAIEIPDSNLFVKVGYTDNLYAATDYSDIPAKGSYPPVPIIEKEVADFSYDEKVYENVAILATIPSDQDVSDINYPGATLNPLVNETADNYTQDSVYLKNGIKASGKLLRKSKKEYRFQTLNGAIFNIPVNEVEKIVLGDNQTTIPQDQEKDRMKIHPLVVIGLVLTSAGLVGLPLGLLAGALDTLNFSAAPAIIAGCALLTGNILTAVGLRAIKNNPYRYRGKKLGKAGIIVEMVVAGIILLLTLLILFSAGAI